MPVFMIAWANIKKKKGVAFSMGILIMLASALFLVGLTMLSELNRFYDVENDRLMGPHYAIRFSGNEYHEEYLDFFRQDSRVELAEASEIVLMDMAAFPEGGVISANFINMDAGHKMDAYRITEQTVVPEEEAVFIPAFMAEMGYKPGDVLTLLFNKNEYQFKIAGYTESTWFHSSVSSLVNFIMPEQSYEKLFQQLGGGYLLNIRLKDTGDIAAVQQDFKENTDVKIEAIALDSKIMEFTIDQMRTGSTMVVTLLSAVLFLFSFLMVIVALIVMKFRITNHIETQMRSIGALQAVGYTGRQIVWSIVLEFLMIGVVGTLFGIGASYGVIKGLGGLISSSVGVAWSGGAHVGYDLLGLLIIVGIVLFVAWISASKAARLLPVEALRGGIKSHSFKRSYFPLEHTNGPVSVALGLKNMIFNSKQYLMVGAIFIGISFACVFAVAIYWNMGLDDDLALQLTGYEISDVMVYAAPHADYDQLNEKLQAMEGVRKTSLYEAKSARVGGELLTCNVSDDFDRLEMVTVYEGSFPKYDNEIAITGTLAKLWGKKIGDTVVVETDGATASYVICGLGQTMNNFGRQCFMNMSGFMRVEPYYKRESIQVYLDPEEDIDLFIAEMEQEFSVLSPSKKASETGETETPAHIRLAAKKAEEKLAALISMYGADSAQYALMVDGQIILSGDTGFYEIDRIENNRKLFVTSVNSIASSVALMSMVILAATLLMIILVLHMVIRSILVRQKPEFGIYKAVGYTDRQLMELIAISFLPASAGGTIIGSVAACLSVNRMASLLFGQLGISKLELSVEPGVILAVMVFLVAFAYCVSMLLARKLKDITVYGLLSEE